jgi:hypothetical protein
MSKVLKLDSNGAPLTIALPNIKEDSDRRNDLEISEARLDTSGGSEDTQPAGSSGNRSVFPALKPTWLASPSAGDLKLPPSSPYDNFLKAAGC